MMDASLFDYERILQNMSCMRKSLQADPTEQSDYLLNPDTPLPHMSSVKEFRQSVDQAYQGFEPTNTPMPMH